MKKKQNHKLQDGKAQIRQPKQKKNKNRKKYNRTAKVNPPVMMRLKDSITWLLEHAPNLDIELRKYLFTNI